MVGVTTTVADCTAGVAVVTEVAELSSADDSATTGSRQVPSLAVF